jgi:hypothetical protein
MKKIKTWQYVAIIGTLGVILIYVKRQNIKNYINSSDFLRRLLVENAIKWVGTKEVGNNNGFANATFQQMMKEAGWTNGDAWCLYFCKAIYLKVFPNEKAQINAEIEGNTQDTWNNLPNNPNTTFMKITSGKPMVGDIAIWQHTDKPWSGHAGLVIDVGEATFTTIEGNTSDKNISNGDLVAKNTRPLVYGGKIPNSDLNLRGFLRKRNII